MKYLNKYNKFSLNESKFEEENINQLLPDLVDIVQDIADKGYLIWFESPNGKISISDYIDNGDVSDFKPTFKAGNKIKNKLNIVINSNSASKHMGNEEFGDIVSEMTTAIDRLADIGWIFDNFNV